MNVILPGIRHWTAMHPKIKFEVNCYWLPEARVLIDPLLPEEGIEVFDPAPEQILLTNRHHYRDSAALVERFGCKVRCVEQGLHEFTSGETIEPFRFGDTLAGGIESIEIGVLCPDEGALLLPAQAIALADSVMRWGNGPLVFVPDQYMGEDPEAVKAGLKRALHQLLERDFDHLLLAHGLPWIGGAKQALRDFVEG